MAIRWLLFGHRWLGIAIGGLMLLWFLSGFVMMYVDYPEVGEAQKLAVSAPIRWGMCCNAGDAALMADDQPILSVRIEDFLGTPVARVRRPGRPETIIDLTDGRPIEPVIDLERATATAAGMGRNLGIDIPPAYRGPMERDQWTVGGNFNRHRPIFHFAFDDPKQTELYISGTTGELIQLTTGRQRFWNWLGAIPHWLYLTELRKDPALWTQIVIYTSLVGVFLTATGIATGLCRLRLRGGRSWSPYRGFSFWHHASGLVFGVLTLTWVASGLLSMNPWGLLESESGPEGPSRLPGGVPPWRPVKASIEGLAAGLESETLYHLTLFPYQGRLFWLGAGPGGKVTRYDRAGGESSPSEAEFAHAADLLAGQTPIASQGLIAAEDNYFFDLQKPAPLPAYRIVLNDEQKTRYYLDGKSGALVAAVDRNARLYRWLHFGFHRLDFTSGLRQRPVWDAVVIFMLLGGTALAGTGTYMAFRRLLRDMRSA